MIQLFKCEHPEGYEIGYMSEEGHVLKREFIPGADENFINHKWVLRAPDGSWMDSDRYRHDLVERNGMKICYSN